MTIEDSSLGNLRSSAKILYSSWKITTNLVDFSEIQKSTLWIRIDFKSFSEIFFCFLIFFKINIVASKFEEVLVTIGIELDTFMKVFDWLLLSIDICMIFSKGFKINKVVRVQTKSKCEVFAYQIMSFLSHCHFSKDIICVVTCLTWEFNRFLSKFSS